jgi:hypothetical protein
MAVLGVSNAAYAEDDQMVVHIPVEEFANGATPTSNVNGAGLIKPGRSVSNVAPGKEIAIEQTDGSRRFFKNVGTKQSPVWQESAFQAGAFQTKVNTRPVGYLY